MQGPLVSFVTSVSEFLSDTEAFSNIDAIADGKTRYGQLVDLL